MSSKILEKGGKTKGEVIAKSFKLDYFDLKESAYGKDIEAALPDKHLFGVAEVYSIIGGLIENASSHIDLTLPIDLHGHDLIVPISTSVVAGDPQL